MQAEDKDNVSPHVGRINFGPYVPPKIDMVDPDTISAAHPSKLVAPRNYPYPSNMMEAIEANAMRREYTLRPCAEPLLPSDAEARKAIPLASGVLDYFTAALIEVARVSKAGNDQHNPGQPMHWARGKSIDVADTLLRHFVERGTVDNDGMRHSAKLAWRALALLQLELEAAGAPMARGAK